MTASVIEMSKPPRSVTKQQTVIEVFMPLGMRLFSGLYFIAGLSGIMFGTLTINQGFFENYIDTQTLLVLQGAVLLALGGAMFLVAIGMLSGARWALDVAKRVSGISIVWALIGIPLAAYTALDFTGTDSLSAYATIGWLVAFALVASLGGLRYLFAAGTTIRKYGEYVTTEPVSREYKMLPSRVESRHPAQGKSAQRNCLDCNSEVPRGASLCPVCGAPQGGT